jgi:hypothetical protein
MGRLLAGGDVLDVASSVAANKGARIQPPTECHGT